ncbi:Do family serine endopeptidase [Minwuia thermotolerans]|uniref:Serine protease n=1 Tax=Minwuia thermotolerans TaxID=2056226 RepID=A0A2M9FYH3_9PROT|nr:Do family serine endopeptidase [Minwuia thermotolerans]PJK28508.1 serine protease [Minwuia thermotolerans]
MLRLATILILLLGPVLSAGAEEARRAPGDRTEMMLSFAPVVEKTAPAVVNIYAKRMVRRRANPLLDDPFFRRFFGDAFGGGAREQEVPSLGSGVIVDPSGLIVTNAHVIEDADDITVVLHDRREFAAEIVLTDKESDLAVLRLERGDLDLPVLAFRDSDTLKVGDIVLAIGNPFGVGQTVTSGIVSGLGRSRVTGAGGPQNFIQTDAAINPGNSGGALVTLDGRLAGINTAIFSRSGGSHGVGFAIPAALVRAVVEGARSGQGIVRPWIGMSGQELTADIAEGLGRARPGGVLVADIYPGGPAERAGLQTGDVILAFDGRPVANPADFEFRLATRSVGDVVDLDVWRRGSALDVQLPLQRAPEVPPRNVTLLEDAHPLQGAEVANLSPALIEEIGFAGPDRGVVVLRVRRGSQAARLGVRPGDVVVEVNGRRVSLVRELEPLLLAVRERWTIRLRRDGGDFILRARRG